MATKTNQPLQEKNKDFGLPQGRFEPIEFGRKKWLKITAIIVGLVLSVGAGIVYWFFYYPPSDVPSSIETHPIHEEYESKAPEVDVDLTDTDKELETSEAVEGEGVENTQDFNTPHTTNPEKGTITKINAPRGYYYVVVGSFIDDDLASDYANQLVQRGVNVMLIAPPKGQYFFRVAIDQKEAFYDANEKATALKEEYGADIWVMKY